MNDEVEQMKPVGIFVVPSDYDSLKAKGVLQTILDRDESGYLSAVETIHPFALHDRIMDFAPNSRIHEFQQPRSHPLRVVSWVRFLLHLLRVSRAVAALARRPEPVFIRAQDPYFSGIVGYVASLMARRPFCISLHSDYTKMAILDPKAGAPRLFGSRALAKRVERFLLSRAAMVFAISDYIREYALRNGASAARTRVFRHMIDLSLYETPAPAAAFERLGLPSGRCIISAVCRLSRQKFVYDLIEMARQLREKRDDFLLVVAGDGEEADGLKAQVERYDLGANVLLTGFLGPQEVAALRQRSDVCLALLDGRSLMEACAAGRPVVAYDVEWHGELVIDDRTGYLIPEGDWRGLASAVDHLLSDPGTAERFTEAMRAHLLSMYSAEILLRQRCDAYRDLIAR